MYIIFVIYIDVRGTAADPEGSDPEELQAGCRTDALHVHVCKHTYMDRLKFYLDVISFEFEAVC